MRKCRGRSLTLDAAPVPKQEHVGSARVLDRKDSALTAERVKKVPVRIALPRTTTGSTHPSRQQLHQAPTSAQQGLGLLARHWPQRVLPPSLHRQQRQ